MRPITQGDGTHMFINRNNDDLAILISEMMIYTSMMESVIYSDDKEELIELAKNILNKGAGKKPQ